MVAFAEQQPPCESPHDDSVPCSNLFRTFGVRMTRGSIWKSRLAPVTWVCVCNAAHMSPSTEASGGISRVRAFFAPSGGGRWPRCCFVVACLVAFSSLGCSELRARQVAREGNQLFREGEYAAALQKYRLSEELHPGIPQVVLNRGLTCRQLIIPGSSAPEHQQAVDCALEAFQRLSKLEPSDERGQELYVQTLFDGDRFETLVDMYTKRLEADPKDLEAVNALIQIYSRWEKWQETLKWTARRAELMPQDAEAQYGVGVFIFNLLHEKGGAGPNAKYDPRPEANPDQAPPAFRPDDIVGAERVRLANLGIDHLERAVKILPTYREAMAYVTLLYRQRAMGQFDTPDAWYESLNQAEEWRKKAAATAPPPQAEGDAQQGEPKPAEGSASKGEAAKDQAASAGGEAQ